jgi:hypothetical protein
MGNLSCGNLDLHVSVETQVPLVYPARFISPLENPSGLPITIPGSAKSDRYPAGILIAIIPESRSPSARNADRHAPEYAHSSDSSTMSTLRAC